MTPRDEPDHYSLKAQRDGYPARSVYKLEEIDRKFRVIRGDRAVLDVGSSPGSWSLWVLRRHRNAKVVGVDLNPMNFSEPDGFTFYCGDIYDAEVEMKLHCHAPFGTLLSDAAPMTTGCKTVDIARSEALAARVLELSQSLLVPGGNMVLKIFQGGGFQSLTQATRRLFDRVKTFRPRAVRSESFETYLIALGRKEGR